MRIMKGPYPMGTPDRNYVWCKCPQCEANQWVSYAPKEHDEAEVPWHCEGPGNVARKVSVAGQGCGFTIPRKYWIKYAYYCDQGRALCPD